MKFLLLLLCLLQSPVEPVRVTITAPDDKAPDREFLDHARDELNQRRHIALAARRRDYDIWFVVSPITEGDKTVGYAVAVLAITVKTGRFKLMVETGPELQGIAARVVAKLDREVFAKRDKP